jgi:hypothetical protein
MLSRLRQTSAMIVRYDRQRLVYRNQLVETIEARLQFPRPVPSVSLLVNIGLDILSVPDFPIEPTQLIDSFPMSWHEDDHPVTNPCQEAIAGLKVEFLANCRRNRDLVLATYFH